MKTIHIILLFASLNLCMAQKGNTDSKDADKNIKGIRVTTGQNVRPAGEALTFSSRPIDLALSNDGSLLFIKSHTSLIIADAKSWKVLQELPYDKKANASMHGIALSSDDKSLYVTTAGNIVLEAVKGVSGQWEWNRKIKIQGKDKGNPFPCGITLSRDGRHAYVAISRNNSVAVLDLAEGKMISEIEAGIAPFDVALSGDESTLYVSNWGGRRAKDNERTMESSGTLVPVDEHDFPISGTVSKIDLKTNTVVSETETGLHPSDIILNRDGSMLYVANANSDNVSVIDTKVFKAVETISLRPEEKLPFGSITNALALSEDEKTLYAANGGNNAVAVVSLDKNKSTNERLSGFIPAGWFPSAVVVNGKDIFIANTKGDGQKGSNTKEKNKWQVRWQIGSVNKVSVPSSGELANYTKQVKSDALVPQVLMAMERSEKSGLKPVPVPKHSGEPSLFQHVIYVIKENRTYDQILGDINKGNSDPKLCIYGREVTPNHHALADQFVLLDNYYCNGVVSSEGHQWATQGITTDYQEKAWGGWSRSYGFGSDPLVFAPSNFIWDNVLLHGLSFRNYGEFNAPQFQPDTANWIDLYNDFRNHTNKVRMTQIQPMKSLLPYTCTDYPGWGLKIPDQVRVEVFLKELADFEKHGDFPNFMIVYLPQDHTSGKKDNQPTPRAHVADNDLALGRLVEAVSKSKFWPSTCIFVNEDDPQDGFDHVDGHRSLCLVVSPYTKRGKVVSKFYNQCSVLHTIANILGLPPMNQMDAMAPTMEDCFTTKTDLSPYTALKNNIPLDEMNTSSSLLQGEELKSSQTSNTMNFTEPDRINDDSMNRILWFDAKGYNTPYPEKFAGAHGKGLKRLKLKLDNKAIEKDEDERD
ncbi:MAG: alkaline phosphatase family protein [Bacteroidota bacterium]|nr:alkaline phosphatase family protein [Bacteroidota bacterium]